MRQMPQTALPDGAGQLWATRAGLRLHALDFPGVSPAVVLVPGITSPAATWAFVVKALALPNRVIVVDVRGRGYSDDGAGHGLDDYADDLKAVVDAAGLVSPVLAGHSMGARIVARFDRRYPQTAAKVIAMDPPLSGPDRRAYPLPLSFYFDAMDALAAGQELEEMRAASPGWSDARLLERAAWLPTCSRAAIAGAHASFHSESFHADWARLTAPAGLIYGARSPVVRAEDLPALQDLRPAAAYVRVPHAGHMLAWDNLSDTAALLRAQIIEGSDMDQPTDDAAFFAARGFGQRIGFGKRPAIMVIDLTNGFTDPARPLGSDLSGQIAATNRLIALAQAKGLPVILSSVRYDDEGLSDAGIWAIKQKGSASLVASGDGHLFDKRLLRGGNESILYKKYASCFFGTDLVPRLLTFGVDTLILTGTSTSGCVRATAVDACQNGFRPMVVREGVGDRAEAPHRQALFDLDAKYADVVGLEETCAYLETL